MLNTHVSVGPFGMLHPYHLHGYDMCIIEEGKFSKFGNFTTFKEKLAALLKYLKSDQRKPVPRHCPGKDTVPLLSDGYFVARIHTANRGNCVLLLNTHPNSTARSITDTST